MAVIAGAGATESKTAEVTDTVGPPSGGPWRVRL